MEDNSMRNPTGVTHDADFLPSLSMFGNFNLSRMENNSLQDLNAPRPFGVNKKSAQWNNSCNFLVSTHDFAHANILPPKIGPAMHVTYLLPPFATLSIFSPPGVEINSTRNLTTLDRPDVNKKDTRPFYISDAPPPVQILENTHFSNTEPDFSLLGVYLSSLPPTRNNFNFSRK